MITTGKGPDPRIEINTGTGEVARSNVDEIGIDRLFPSRRRIYKGNKKFRGVQGADRPRRGVRPGAVTLNTYVGDRRWPN
jgi:hypothetical protein